MKSKINEMIKKVHTALIENQYCKAKQLAELCHLKPSSIYRIIRMMRIEGIGVLPTKNGYILSEFATKRDDVGFIRRCYGRRAGDFLAISAARKHINSRWRSVTDTAALKTLLEPLVVDLLNSKGNKLLLDLE